MEGNCTLFQRSVEFPKCLGSINGKHVAIKNLKYSGSLYFNYKKLLHIVIMAVANANYKFMMVDLGVNVISYTRFRQALVGNTLRFLEPTQLPNIEKILPLDLWEMIPSI